MRPCQACRYPPWSADLCILGHQAYPVVPGRSCECPSASWLRIQGTDAEDCHVLLHGFPPLLQHGTRAVIAVCMETRRDSVLLQDHSPSVSGSLVPFLGIPDLGCQQCDYESRRAILHDPVMWWSVVSPCLVPAEHHQQQDGRLQRPGRKRLHATGTAGQDMKLRLRKEGVHIQHWHGPPQ